ncbi:pentatricopeptide repeat-containing protein At4g33170-like [Zingiber officinale]|uniref:pentatricopeptide repeat-containing protein At4g33170-like n=1 Tax=Zingiber officinale TaxID=94328 RepID=UPI001C4D679B|nr:pentatricopeptide repeat-containing protein At4g33170-like [Zingiber officinale]XP_042430317.1 pentatricopeptide repeat-containing protein At4g33170-like [Zingiber officinale]
MTNPTFARATFFSVSLLPALRSAATSADVRLLRRVHASIITSGASADRFVVNNLITVYSKCGSLSLARRLFDQTPHRDSVTWNSLLSAYALHGHSSDAFRLFHLLLCSPSVPPTHLTFTPLFKLCSASSDLIPTAQALHSMVIKIGLASDEMVSSALVNIYSKYGFLREARYIFDKMEERDVVLWNIMIKSYNQLGLVQEACFLFAELHRSEVLRPDDNTVRCILLVQRSDELFEQIQAYGIKICFLEDFYDVLSRNKLSSDLVKAGDYLTVLKNFIEMARLNLNYDNVTFVIVLSAVANGEHFEVAEQLHGLIKKLGMCSDVSVSNSILNIYAKMGSLNRARQIFEEMEELDLVSWNTMISVLAQNFREVESVELFIEMLSLGLLPDQFTLASILRACSGITISSSLHEQIHGFLLKQGQINDIFVLTALVDAHAKRGRVEEAEILFRGMDSFDLTFCNALLAGYVANNNSRKALDLFRLTIKACERPNDFTLATVLKGCSKLVALKQGQQVHAFAIKLGFVSDMCVSSGILDMYVKCGHVNDATSVFGDISTPDDVAWTAMISGCVENGDEEYALNLYHQMRQSGVRPDEYTLASLIKACSCLAALGLGKQIHGNVIKFGRSADPFVGTTVLDMYAKCGNIEDSLCLFERMIPTNIASWNVLLLGLAQHGKGKEALNLFKHMILQGLQPDKITLLGVLSACSHSGLVSEAYGYFNSMRKDYCIEPEVEHYSCLVDALGRAGLLQDAEEIMETMPFNASAPMYRALLGACRIQGNMDIGQRIATRLLELEPLDSSAYILLSNIYASVNRWNDVNEARKTMSNMNIKKDPGSSWIEVKSKIHLFVADDVSHPEIAAIYQELEDLIRRIKDKGYIPDTHCVLLDVLEEEKERTLYYHSEKLAIVYGLISTPASSRILVIKNLRVCGDCHNAIKYISNVATREIVLRDASRFHLFKDGACTCGDYW